MKGKQISISELSSSFTQVLSEIEDVLLIIKTEYPSLRLQYSDDDLAAATTIFFDAMLSKMWDLQERDGVSFGKRCLMADACGNEIHDLIKKFTGVSMREIYKTE